MTSSVEKAANFVRNFYDNIPVAKKTSFEEDSANLKGCRFEDTLSEEELEEFEAIVSQRWQREQFKEGRIKTEYLIRKEVIEEWKTRNNTKML